MKKIILLLVLSLNIQTFGGRGVSGDGRIRVVPDFEEDMVRRLPWYIVDNGDPISLAVALGYTGFSTRISTDGSVIAGMLFNVHETGYWSDYRGSVWRQTQVIDGTLFYSGPILLPSLDVLSLNWMTDMSINGKYLAGRDISHSGDRYQAVYWDENRDVHSLGSLYHDSLIYNQSSAEGVRNDKIIVGMTYAGGANTDLGFIWDEQHGMRYIKDVLEQEYNYDFGDNILASAGFGNPEGTIIEGNGYTSTGELFFWTATIPEPATILLLGLGAIAVRRRS